MWEFARLWGNLGRFWLQPMSTNIGQDWRVDFGRIEPHVGQSWPEFGQFRPILAETYRSLVDAGNELGNCWPMCPRSWQSWAGFGKIRPNIGQPRPKLGPTLGTFGEIRPTLGQSWPNVGRMWPAPAKFGHKLTEFDKTKRRC